MSSTNKLTTLLGGTRRELIDENVLWSKIRKMALDDPGLRSILDSAIMYYNLRKPNGKT